MMNNSTIEVLRKMRFGAMAGEFERQLNDLSTYSQLGFEERFALMVDAEWNRRQQNRLTRCIREARFAAPGAMIEDIEYHEDRRLDKAQLLRFSTCAYIDEGHHIILKGASGNKTILIKNMQHKKHENPTNIWVSRVFAIISIHLLLLLLLAGNPTLMLA